VRKQKSEYAIQTVSNALRLLETFRQEEELGVTEISRRLGLHKNNAFRLLATLEQHGYIEQTPENERYRLGVRCFELGRSYSRSHKLLRRARRVLVALSRETAETAHLAVLGAFDVVHLDGEAPERSVLAAPRVGESAPSHCTALGKVLLGCADPATREGFDREIASQHELVKRTPATIVDPHKVFEHLRTVAGQGWAVDLEEYEPDLCCAAAPVHDAEGRVIAALSISGPAFRLDEAMLHQRVVPAVRQAAERLSRDLGYETA